MRSVETKVPKVMCWLVESLGFNPRAAWCQHESFPSVLSLLLSAQGGGAKSGLAFTCCGFAHSGSLVWSPGDQPGRSQGIFATQGPGVLWCVCSRLAPKGQEFTWGFRNMAPATQAYPVPKCILTWLLWSFLRNSYPKGFSISTEFDMELLLTIAENSAPRGFQWLQLQWRRTKELALL